MDPDWFVCTVFRAPSQRCSTHVYYGMRDYPGYSEISLQAVSDLTAVILPMLLEAIGVYPVFPLSVAFVHLIVSSKTNKTFWIGIGLYTIMNCVSGRPTLFPLSGREFQDVMHFYVRR